MITVQFIEESEPKLFGQRFVSMDEATAKQLEPGVVMEITDTSKLVKWRSDFYITKSDFEWGTFDSEPDRLNVYCERLTGGFEVMPPKSPENIVISNTNPCGETPLGWWDENTL